MIRESRGDSPDNFVTKDCCQIILIKKGFFVSGSYTFEKHNLIFINANSRMEIGKPINHEFIHMIFKPRLIDIMNFSETERNLYQEIFLNDTMKNDRLITYILDNETVINITILLKKMMEEFDKKAHSYHMMIKGLFLEMLVTLSRDHANNPRLDVKTPVDIIMDHIDENYCEDISLGDLSALVNMNPSYISRMFKEKTGEGIFEYINGKRIKKAAHLLKNTSLGILEIAMMVGYNNLSFFNRTFRKIMNTNPKEYRR